LFAFLDSKPDIVDAPDARPLDADKMSVAFENVSFEYNPGEPVLTDITLKVPAGKVCALVGPSGGGKTTMFNLLERFYEPQMGKITINRTDIKKYTLKSLRQNIAEVSQTVFLFNGSIEDNIKYGNPDATHDQVVAAARAANAHDFIMDFPKQYQTSVGEGGALLSGGQKQRVGIARALAAAPDILLMDEPFGAVDEITRKGLQEELLALQRKTGITVVFITHDIGEAFHLGSRVFIMKDGKIWQEGKPEELQRAPRDEFVRRLIGR